MWFAAWWSRPHGCRQIALGRFEIPLRDGREDGVEDDKLSNAGRGIFA